MPLVATDDFMADLALPTTVKTVGQSAGFEDIAIAEQPAAAEPLNAAAAAPEAKYTAGPAAPEIKPAGIGSSLSASIVLETLDGVVLQAGGEMFHEWRLKKRRFNGDEDFERCKELYLKNQSTKLTNEDEIKQAERFARFESELDKKIAKLPLTDSERKRTLIPLEKIMEQTNGDLPPWLGLVMALGQIVVSRLFI